MQIIPAIDLKDNKVVKAFAGFRLNYKPLILNKKDFSDPILLINSLNRIFDFNIIYIADLDSILGKNNNWNLINKILSIFPKKIFWLDAGFNSPKLFEKFKTKKKVKNLKPIIATESLNSNFTDFNYFKKCEAIISLDINGKEDSWIKRISKLDSSFLYILMFINKIGGRGIDWNYLKKLKKNINFNKSYLAGGIRFKNEIEMLRRSELRGVIVSSMLHKKLY